MDMWVMILYLVSTVMQDTRNMTFFAKRYLASGQQQVFEVLGICKKVLPGRTFVHFLYRQGQTVMCRWEKNNKGRWRGPRHGMLSNFRAARHVHVFDFFAVPPYPAKRAPLAKGTFVI